MSESEKAHLGDSVEVDVVALDRFVSLVAAAAGTGLVASTAGWSDCAAGEATWAEAAASEACFGVVSDGIFFGAAGESCTPSVSVAYCDTKTTMLSYHFLHLAGIFKLFTLRIRLAPWTYHMKHVS